MDPRPPSPKRDPRKNPVGSSSTEETVKGPSADNPRHSTSGASVVPPHSPDDRFGKFVRTEKLGAGGMGEVWKAWDVELARWVALKFLKGGDDAEIARFKHEAQVAGQLAHPHIAAVYEVGEARGRHYIAMQYIQGPTLRTRRRGDVRRLAALLRDAAKAVAFAHEHGVIHRDLKPENLMVAERSGGAEPHVYVMDFGLARSVEGGSELSASGAVVGTPSYMAPEQARGEKLDERADVYSLGATIYQLLADRPPHRGANLLQTLRLVQDEEPKPPSAWAPGIDRELETIVLKCLDRDPARRYPGALELARDLDRWLRGEAIEAHGPSFTYRAAKWMRRRALVLGLSAAALAAVAITLAVLVPKWRSASDRASAAEGEVRAAEALRARMQKLSALWAHALTIKEWTHQAYRKVEDIRAEFRRCERDVTAFLEEAPGLPQGLYVRARVRMCLEEFDDAERDLLEATRRAPDFRPAWTLLGHVRIERFWRNMLGPGDEGLDDADTRELEGAGEAFRRGDPGRAAAEAWGLAWSPDDDAAQLVARALQEYYVDGKGQEAVDRLAKAAETSTSDEVFRWLGVWTHRADLISRAIDISPFHPAYYVQRAALLRHQRRHGEAIEDCTKAIQLQPGYAAAYNNRGALLAATGRVREGLEDFDRAIAADPGFAIARVNRGWRRMQQGDLDGAMADFDHVLEMKPRSTYITSMAHQHRGAVWSRRGESERAIAEFTRAVEIHPKNAAAWIERCVEKRRTDPRGALEDVEQALKIDPRSPEALMNRGDLRISLQDREGALQDYSQAIRLSPEDPVARLKRASLRYQERDYGPAEEDLEESLRLAPPGWPYRAMAEDLGRMIREAK